MYHISPLTKGLLLATAHLPHMASVSVGLWVGVGGRCESPDQNGISHFIEHLLFKGTRRRSAQQISQAVEGVGGYLNAFTSEENTCFYAKARGDHLEDLLNVLADMFLHSKFDPADIEKERGVIKEEVAMYLDQPHHHVQELLNATLWPDHPLGRPLTGTERTLDAISRTGLLSYQRSHYVAPATILAVAGNFSPSKLARCVGRLAPHFHQGQRPHFSPVTHVQRQPAFSLFTKPVEQTQLALGLRTCSRHDDRRFSLRLLSTILGENMSSRLFQTVREDRGLAYSISSSTSFFEDVGDLDISAGLETDNLAETIKLIVRELRRLRERVPSRAEVQRARDYLIGQIDLSMENTESQMMWLGEQLLGFGRIFTPREIKRRLCQVQPSQVRSVARDFFRAERINLALVSPLKRDRGLREILVRGLSE